MLRGKEKMKRKILIIVILVFIFAACGKKDEYIERVKSSHLNMYPKVEFGKVLDKVTKNEKWLHFQDEDGNFVEFKGTLINPKTKKKIDLLIQWKVTTDGYDPYYLGVDGESVALLGYGMFIPMVYAMYLGIDVEELGI